MLRRIHCVASIAALGGLLLRRTGVVEQRGAVSPDRCRRWRLPGSVSEKTYLDINGVRQGMFLQGADGTNPVLLYLHGGMPDFFFFTERYPTGLERVFTVAWWDRRGAGLSYDARISLDFAAMAKWPRTVPAVWSNAMSPSCLANPVRWPAAGLAHRVCSEAESVEKS